VVGHVQIYEEQCESNEYKNHPDGRRYHHRTRSTVHKVGRYASNANIVGPK
jgi:hypothetical protein